MYISENKCIVIVIAYQSYSNFEFSVADIMNIQNGGRYTAARSRIYFSLMILTIKNYQYKKCHAFMTIWTI